MRVFLPGLMLVLALLSPSLADGNSERNLVATPSAGPANEDLNQVVCKETGPLIGSHLGRRKICQTKKKWLEQERATQDAVQQSEHNGKPGG